MNDVARSVWPWFSLRGVFAVAFSTVSIIWPGVTLVVAARLLAIWLLVDGVTTLVRAATMSKLPSTERSPVSVIGVAGIAVSLFGLFSPVENIRTLGVLLGMWFVLSGISLLSFGAQAHRRLRVKTAVKFMGLASVLAGVLTFALPGAGAETYWRMVATVATSFGLVSFYAAQSMRGLSQQKD